VSIMPDELGVPLDQRTIAYFSMEAALSPALPTYAGGLGVLAGDTIRAAADLRVPMVGVTLLHRQGHFHQTIDDTGWQHEAPEPWDIAQHAEELAPRVRVRLAGRDVQLRAWQYTVRGCFEQAVPVLLLDADLPDNQDNDRRLTDRLYIGDRCLRLAQEVILGVGGVRMLRALGLNRVHRFHLNEGHAALLAAELLREHMLSHGKTAVDDEAIAAVRDRCVFTTHTPVPSGHDRFTHEQIHAVIEEQTALERSGLFEHDGMLNLTYTGLNLSRYVNGVAKRHGEVSRHMFASYTIDAITNGVHAATWTGNHMARVFDEHIPGWREDSFNLRYAAGIPLDVIAAAHRQAKRDLFDRIQPHTITSWDPHALTIGFARRATAYKRPTLLLTDLDRLEHIAKRHGMIQFVFAGKAHPDDNAGKKLIQNIIQLAKRLPPSIKLAYLPDYNTDLARYMVAGVDIWLNTPRPPLEASGTSGMKAALNGVPSLSTLDGWWLEGCIEAVTGWSIGPAYQGMDPDPDDDDDAASLYDKLEHAVVPLFYNDSAAFNQTRRHSIALNGSFFNTHRMLQEYVVRAYL
jgi:starch phosphorylase